MLEVQKWLRANNGNLELLKEQLGIRTVENDDGRVIFNYSQTDSPKTNFIVQECRALTLNREDNWKIVARAFGRFFNYGEVLNLTERFDWDNCTSQHKEDGSLILVYYWRDEWRIQTRGSYADGLIGDSPITWNQLVSKCLPLEFFNRGHFHGYCYVFELCSLYNKIVRDYFEPILYHLTTFDTWNNKECGIAYCDEDAESLGLNRPNVVRLENIEEVKCYIKSQGDKTFEGIVLRDGNGLRVKIKNPDYLLLHRMSNNGNPVALKNVLPFIMSGEVDELLTYFGELKDYVYEIQERVDKLLKELDKLWFSYGDIQNRKRYANLIKSHRFEGNPSPLLWIMFMAKDQNVHPHEIISKNKEKFIDFLVKAL